MVQFVFRESAKRDDRLGALLSAYNDEDYKVANHVFRQLLVKHSHDINAMDVIEAFLDRTRHHESNELVLNAACDALEALPPESPVTKMANEIILERCEFVLRNHGPKETEERLIGATMIILGNMYKIESLPNPEKVADLIVRHAPIVMRNNLEETAYALQSAVEHMPTTSHLQRKSGELLKGAIGSFMREKDFEKAIEILERVIPHSTNDHEGVLFQTDHLKTMLKDCENGIKKQKATMSLFSGSVKPVSPDDFLDYMQD